MIAQSLIHLVRQRAQGICEYCHFPESVAETPFQLDHIIAQKHSGPTVDANLAWSCFFCNNGKGSDIAGLDPLTRQLTRLFNPRSDQWAEHFTWSGAELVGLTDIGRTTVTVLGINRPMIVLRRAALIAEGVYPLT